MNAYKQVVVADRQSLVDIALQEYGCYEGLFTLLDDNSDRLKAIDEIPVPGMILNIKNKTPILKPENRAIVSEYDRQKHIVAGNATGANHIHDTVSSYVTMDYLAPLYTSPPQHTRNLISAAGLDRLRAFSFNTSDWNE